MVAAPFVQCWVGWSGRNEDPGADDFVSPRVKGSIVGGTVHPVDALTPTWLPELRRYELTELLKPAPSGADVHSADVDVAAVRGNEELGQTMSGHLHDLEHQVVLLDPCTTVFAVVLALHIDDARTIRYAHTRTEHAARAKQEKNAYESAHLDLCSEGPSFVLLLIYVPRG